MHVGATPVFALCIMLPDWSLKLFSCSAEKSQRLFTSHWQVHNITMPDGIFRNIITNKLTESLGFNIWPFNGKGYAYCVFETLKFTKFLTTESVMRLWMFSSVCDTDSVNEKLEWRKIQKLFNNSKMFEYKCLLHSTNTSFGCRLFGLWLFYFVASFDMNSSDTLQT